MLLSAIANAAFGVYLGKIVDGVSAQDKDFFTQSIIVVVAAVILDMIFNILGWKCVYFDSCKKAENLKNKIYQHELKKGRTENIDISKFSNKIDMIFTDDYLNRWFIYNNLVLFIFSCLGIVLINWVMLPVAVLVSVLPMVMPNLFKKYVQNAASAYADESSKYIKYINNTLQGRLEIVKYGVIHTFCRNHNIANHKFENMRYKNKTANRNARNITGAAGMISMMIIFLVGGILAFAGLMEIGGVIGIIQLMNNVVNPVTNIAASKNEINSCKPVVKELNEETKTEFNNSENKNLVSLEHADNFSLTVNDIVYSYPSSKEKIINHFSCQFKFGNKYLIQGESGSGKTTLAKLMIGELHPEAGDIEINGVDIGLLSEEYLMKLVTYVDQKVYIFEDSIINNITLYRDIDKNKIVDIMDSLGIQKLDENKLVNDDNGISGGQKARVCLARATTILPQILIVDEPTAALDMENTKKVMEYLCSLPITVIIISHSMKQDIIDLFDSIIYLEQ